MGNVFLGSLLLSIIHSILFFRQRWGISIFLFMIAALFLLTYILSKYDKIKDKKALVLRFPILILSLTYLLFNNPIFNITNMIVIIILLGIMIVWMIAGKVRLSLILSNLINIFLGPIEFVNVAFKIIGENLSKFFKAKEKTKTGKAKKIVKALIITIPIVLIVLFLLVSSDPIFERIFGKIADGIIELFTSIEFLYLLLRIFLISVLTVYFISVLYNLISEKTTFQIMAKEAKEKGKLNIDNYTINVVLSGLNIVYLIFCTIQLASLFTKTGFMNNNQYADYARQGFFQLMIVTLLNFIVILISLVNKKEESQRSKTYKNTMNVLMLIFTFIILMSSFVRMNLYETTLGYTTLRLWVYTVLITEVLLLIPTVIYILKRKINLFGWYFGIIISMYLILNFTNTQSIIAKRNIDMYMTQTGKLDIDYLIRDTGVDAVEQMLRLLEETPKVESIDNLDVIRRKVNNHLYELKEELLDEENKDTIFSYNFNRNKARKLLKEKELEYKPYTSNYNNYYDYSYPYNNIYDEYNYDDYYDNYNYYNNINY